MTDSTRPSRMVERVAKALYETAVKQAREEVSKFVIPIDKIRTVFNAALAASDREAAIIVFCLIDDIITDFFRLKLKGDIDIESSFFANNGILATAHAKLTLLAGLKWIELDDYQDLSLIRKVRNQFAHHVDHDSFDKSPTSGLITSMSAKLETAILNTLPEENKPAKLSIRGRYFVRSALTISHSIANLAIIQAAQSHRVPPLSIASTYDNQPDNLRTLLLLASELALTSAMNDKHKQEA
jgi:DNA-binding MltR family transcriptional regulator